VNHARFICPSFVQKFSTGWLSFGERFTPGRTLTPSGGIFSGKVMTSLNVSCISSHYYVAANSKAWKKGNLSKLFFEDTVLNLNQVAVGFLLLWSVAGKYSRMPVICREIRSGSLPSANR